MDAAAVDKIAFDTVPFARVVGVHVTKVEPERAEAVLELTPERLNHVGTMHAVAQFGLGELASGGLVVAAFSDLQQDGYMPLVASVTVSYLRPARTDLRGVAELSLAEQERVRSEVRSGIQSRFTLPVQIIDTHGAVVSEFKVEWVLLQPRA
jgi:acyl-coenzyme A thioesterase PaaI-like protein